MLLVDPIRSVSEVAFWEVEASCHAEPSRVEEDWEEGVEVAEVDRVVDSAVGWTLAQRWPMIRACKLGPLGW